MKKPSFAIWATLITAVLLVGICAAVFLLGDKYVVRKTGVIEIREKIEAKVVDLTVAETPEPTQEPRDYSANAVDILKNGEAVLTISSRMEAEQLLETYLKKMGEAIPETERLLQAEYPEEIHITESSLELEQMSYTEALEKLLSDAEILPVKVITQSRTTGKGEIAKEEQELSELVEGYRVISQLGRAEKKETIRTKTYISGKEEEPAKEETRILFDAYPTILLKGRFRFEKNDGEPGKKEGPKGKDKKGLSLILPIQVAASSFFGMRNGQMHNGMDFQVKEGTEIKAPGEGIVIYAGTRGDYGTVIDIEHENGFVSRIARCSDVRVELNQRVFQGDIIAVVAETGSEDEKPHLHYELLIDGIPYNPMYYFD